MVIGSHLGDNPTRFYNRENNRERIKELEFLYRENSKVCFLQIGTVKLVTEEIINPEGFYNYLTAWFNVDNSMYYVSQASFFPVPPSWQPGPVSTYAHNLRYIVRTIRQIWVFWLWSYSIRVTTLHHVIRHTMSMLVVSFSKCIIPDIQKIPSPKQNLAS